MIAAVDQGAALRSAQLAEKDRVGEDRQRMGAAQAVEGRADGRHSIGAIVALETYPGESITALFHAANGGTFHDLPLATFRADGHGHDGADDGCDWIRRYGMPDRGLAVMEPGELLGEQVSLFGASGLRVGGGRVMCMIHWPSGNKLLHLVITDGGQLVLVLLACKDCEKRDCRQISRV